MADWTLEPLELAVVALVGVAALAAWRTASALRRAAIALAVGLLLVALVSPLAAAGEDRSLALHLLQHVLLWDLAPIAFLAAAGRLPPGFPRALANPAVALPLWLASLAFWHVPPVFDAALSGGVLHGLQHAELFAAGIAMWAPLVGAVAAPAWFGVGWRFGYVAAMQLAGLAFANVLLWSGSPLYSTPADPLGGISPLTDQRIAGGIVLIEGSLVALGFFTWLFFSLVELAPDGGPANATGDGSPNPGMPVRP